jgi:hypothetical protein
LPVRVGSNRSAGDLPFLNLDPSVKKVFKIAGFDILVD